MQITYQVEYDKKSDGYNAFCPSMKSVIIYTKKRKDVPQKMKEAIELYLERHPETLEKSQTETLNV